MRRKHSQSPPGPVLAMLVDDPLRLIDRAETCREFGNISPATLYRGVATGRYPSPIKVGPNAVRWVLAEIRDCKLEMMNARGVR